MTMDLADKVAVITGGAGGIGSATANLLSARGAVVVIADINLGNAKKIANALVAKGRQAFAVEVNMMSEESVEGLVAAVKERHGRIDVLVNNAGVISAEPMLDLDVEQWDRVIDINLRGTFLCSKAAMRVMVEQKSGKIVNIASMAGQLGGLKVSPDYTASKAGIISLGKAFARYGAAYGINVNNVAPGLIETDMTKGRGDDPASVPLGRLGTAEDVAKAVYFLASPLSDYITGTTIDVNGGLLMR